MEPPGIRGIAALAFWLALSLLVADRLWLESDEVFGIAVLILAGFGIDIAQRREV